MHSDDKLDELIEEAIVDAYDEQEQRAGFHALLEDSLDFPFAAKLIGEQVIVQGLDMRDGERILACVNRNGQDHYIDVLDLQIEDDKVSGSEWIAAYRRWGSYV